MSKPIVYFASKMHNADVGRVLRTKWISDIIINSRWIDMEHLEKEATQADFTRFWVIDEEDIRQADSIIIYGENIADLRGALVEAGIGIALNKDVYVIGFSPCYGTWQFHPNVWRVNSFDDAVKIILDANR